MYAPTILSFVYVYIRMCSGYDAEEGDYVENVMSFVFK